MLGGRERRGRPDARTGSRPIGRRRTLAARWMSEASARRADRRGWRVRSRCHRRLRRCERATGHVLSRGISFRIAPFGRLARGRCDRPMACGSFASSMPRQAHHLAAASPVANSAGHRWSRFGRSASRRSSASRQASSARRPIAFIARTSILAPRSDCEERRLATRWRTHAPCRVPPAGRSRRPCAAAPWVSSRSSSARICFSSASETRLRLT